MANSALVSTYVSGMDGEVNRMVKQAEKKRLLMLVPSMRGGGAERVFLTLSQNLNREKFNLFLTCVQLEGEYVQDLPNDIEISSLGVKRTIKAFIPLLSRIKEVKPDVILSTSTQMNILLLLIKPFIKSDIKILIREGSIVSNNIKENKLLYSLLYKKLYNKADCIICQSEYMAQDLIENFHINPKLTKIIRNPVDFNKIERMSSNSENPFATFSNCKSKNILSIGRLSSEKNHKQLIKSFGENLASNNKYKLFILGQGPLKSELNQLIKNFNIENQVFLVGFDNNPYKWLKHADLFLLPSEYEGLPNSLLEAIACTTPVIVTNHVGGTREIMQSVGLGNRIVDCLDWSEWWFSLPDKSVKENLFEQYNVKSIVGQYEKIILGAL